MGLLQSLVWLGKTPPPTTAKTKTSHARQGSVLCRGPQWALSVSRIEVYDASSEIKSNRYLRASYDSILGSKVLARPRSVIIPIQRLAFRLKVVIRSFHPAIDSKILLLTYPRVNSHIAQAVNNIDLNSMSSWTTLQQSKEPTGSRHWVI